MITQAIVRPPGKTFAGGLTQSGLGPPDRDVALRQHDAYCAALESAGLTLRRLPSDDQYPDSPFVEDTAVVIESDMLLTRPGAESRRGEVAGIREALAGFRTACVEAPGTLDGGDVCEADGVLFVGLSRRTNHQGIEQLDALAVRHGLRTAVIDIRASTDLLHLKSGLSSLGGRRLLICEELAGKEEFRQFDLVVVPANETYAANSVLVGPNLLIPSGFPVTRDLLDGLGYRLIILNMSEFRKMDGGISCLSLRF